MLRRRSWNRRTRREVTIPGAGNTKVEGTSGNGSNLVLRAGLAIGLR